MNSTYPAFSSKALPSAPPLHESDLPPAYSEIDPAANPFVQAPAIQPPTPNIHWDVIPHDLYQAAAHSANMRRITAGSLGVGSALLGKITFVAATALTATPATVITVVAGLTVLTATSAITALYYAAAPSASELQLEKVKAQRQEMKKKVELTSPTLQTLHAWKTEGIITSAEMHQYMKEDINALAYPDLIDKHDLTNYFSALNTENANLVKSKFHAYCKQQNLGLQECLYLPLAQRTGFADHPDFTYALANGHVEGKNPSMNLYNSFIEKHGSEALERLNENNKNILAQCFAENSIPEIFSLVPKVLLKQALMHMKGRDSAIKSLMTEQALEILPNSNASYKTIIEFKLMPERFLSLIKKYQSSYSRAKEEHDDLISRLKQPLQQLEGEWHQEFEDLNRTLSLAKNNIQMHKDAVESALKQVAAANDKQTDLLNTHHRLLSESENLKTFLDCNPIEHLKEQLNLENSKAEIANQTLANAKALLQNDPNTALIQKLTVEYEQLKAIQSHHNALNDKRKSLKALSDQIATPEFQKKHQELKEANTIKIVTGLVNAINKVLEPSTKKELNEMDNLITQKKQLEAEIAQLEKKAHTYLPYDLELRLQQLDQIITQTSAFQKPLKDQIKKLIRESQSNSKNIHTLQEQLKKTVRESTKLQNIQNELSLISPQYILACNKQQELMDECQRQNKLLDHAKKTADDCSTRVEQKIIRENHKYAEKRRQLEPIQIQKCKEQLNIFERKVEAIAKNFLAELANL